MGKGEVKRMMKRVNSTIMYWKNFCKSHKVHPVEE
jgi:hypothetical protein